MSAESSLSTPVAAKTDSELLRILSRVPRIARWLWPVSAILLRGTSTSSIAARERSLVVLRMAAIDRSAYWLEQRGHALAAGVSQEEVDAVLDGTWGRLTSFSVREAAAVRWTENVATNEAKRDRDSFAELEGLFDAGEVVELTAIAAICALLDRFANAHQIPPEDPFESEGASSLNSDSLATWADAMFDGGRA